MTPIQWSPDYSVTNRKLDDHHRKLIELINELEVVSKHGKDTLNAQIGIIDQLIEYAGYHFKAEEKLMEKEGYPHLDNHKREHESFAKDVNVFRDRVANKKEEVSQVLTHFLKDWLANHILTKDKQYADYFKSKGIDIREVET